MRALVDTRGPVHLYAATDGNHGRAVARVARSVGASAQVYLPATLTREAKAAIAAEGAQVHELALDYDDVVAAATTAAHEAGQHALLVQDTSWPGYQDVPQWIVDGYATLFEEADDQLAEQGADRIDLVAVPTGVGSLAQAAVRHYRSSDTDPPPSVLGVQATNAAAVVSSLRAGKPVFVPTGHTIMAGLRCGTPSENAWPYLSAGLDAAVTVSDEQAASAVHDLAAAGLDSGPCGPPPWPEPAMPSGVACGSGSGCPPTRWCSC